MFLNIIKNFLLKNKTSKLFTNANVSQTEGLIKSVGVIYDGNLNLEIENLVYELFKNGIEEDQIKVLIFKDKINKKEVSKLNVISYQDINWSGAIDNPTAELYLNYHYDLLINYHDFETPPLVYLSYLSKANFKVGFTSLDKKINQLMINTNPSNYQLFIDELFKYLKILNKY